MSWEWMSANWAVAGGFLAGAVLWGKTVNDVAKNKEDVKAAMTDIGSIKDAVARIETHQEYARAGINDIKEDLKALRDGR